MGIQSFGNRLGQAAGAAGGGLVLLFAANYMYLGVLSLVANLLAIIFFLAASHALKRYENHPALGLT